ncbi:MAG: hypothetical protein ACRCU2_19220 [Planktothrix sp.]
MNYRDNEIQEPFFDIDIFEEIDYSSIELNNRHFQQAQQVHQKLRAVTRFIQYCFMYDPLVSLETGNSIEISLNPKLLLAHNLVEDSNKTYKQIFILNNLIKIPSLKKLKSQYLETTECDNEDYLQKAQMQINCYSCIAPFRIINPEQITEEYLNNYSGKNNQSKVTDKKTDLINKKNAKRFETSEVLYYKQYICCEHEGEKGWIVLYRGPLLSIKDFKSEIIGIGETLLEADLDFQRKRAGLFLETMELKKNVLNSNIPVNINQMKTLCQQYDKNIKHDSFTHEYTGCFKRKTFGFNLTCQSDLYKFTVSVSSYFTKWTVETYIDAKYKIPIEATGESLEEAFEKAKEKHDRILSNPERIHKEIAIIEKNIEDFQPNYDEYIKLDLSSEFE